MKSNIQIGLTHLVSVPGFQVHLQVLQLRPVQLCPPLCSELCDWSAVLCGHHVVVHPLNAQRPPLESGQLSMKAKLQLVHRRLSSISNTLIQLPASIPPSITRLRGGGCPPQQKPLGSAGSQLSNRLQQLQSVLNVFLFVLTLY